VSETFSNGDLYSLHAMRKVHLRVHYPEQLDRMVLRTDMDWDKDVLPSTVDRRASFAEFELELSHPFIYLKPCLRGPSGLHWAKGPNRLLVATGEAIRDIYPAFHSAEEGKILDVITMESRLLNRQHSLRVYLPPGYDENTCRTFPVIIGRTVATSFFHKKPLWGRTGA
jgi:hypothetical protein